MAYLKVTLDSEKESIFHLLLIDDESKQSWLIRTFIDVTYSDANTHAMALADILKIEYKLYTP